MIQVIRYHSREHDRSLAHRKRMYLVSCITYPVSCIMYPVSCIMYPVSCIMYPVSCIMYPVSCILYHVSCIMYPVSCTMYPVLCDKIHLDCIFPVAHSDCAIKINSPKAFTICNA